MHGRRINFADDRLMAVVAEMQSLSSPSTDILMAHLSRRGFLDHQMDNCCILLRRGRLRPPEKVMADPH